MGTRKVLVKSYRPRHDRETVPLALGTNADIHRGVETALRRKRARHEPEAIVRDAVAHVDQHGESPYEIEPLGERDTCERRGEAKNWRLLLQLLFAKLFAALFENISTDFDPIIMAGLEKSDQWNSSAQRAASDIEQVVGGPQATCDKEP